MAAAVTAPKKAVTTARRRVQIPDTMIAEAIDRFGPPEVLTAHRRPVPSVSPNEVLISLRSAGVGNWDARIRDGSWALDKVRFPYVLGVDGAGIVAAKGSRVRRFDVGDRVWSYSYRPAKGGFYAEFVVVPSHDVGHLPDGVDLTHAGMVVATALTAQQGIDDHLRVRGGERVLIFGASGAVGTYAVQIAKLRGAHVIGTATGRDAQELVQRLGADAVVDARDLRDLGRLKQIALDAILATAGGDGLEHCIDLVRKRGRVAYPDGVEPPPKPRTEVSVGSFDAVPGAHELDRLAKLFLGAHLRIPIAAEYSLTHAADAHRRLERGRVLGRIGLRIRH
ncbi:MAG: NADP-dependent oxidoreductase [Deltaproteobacteria bacterium]|nr:NADP-dependent oxidoreductase [Deltaproteobacteria bacterium]MCW5805366.1 NADP-dependent oxidoreductase [Deltaproteobacteria bacterium]